MEVHSFGMDFSAIDYTAHAFAEVRPKSCSTRQMVSRKQHGDQTAANVPNQ